MLHNLSQAEADYFKKMRVVLDHEAVITNDIDSTIKEAAEESTGGRGVFLRSS